MSNRMSFPPPLTGELICPAGSMPKIKYAGGRVTAECCTIPSGTSVSDGTSYTEDFKRWALAQITEDDRYLEWGERHLSFKDEQILAEGRFTLRSRTGAETIVLFKLPAITQEGGTMFGAN
ncbi:hypothetical protein [Hoeflea sp.]|uniref:hypothetical protein n=1 Tax=Hoeflea sp. TaxID=1940281 RepID=UPI003A901882